VRKDYSGVRTKFFYCFVDALLRWVDITRGIVKPLPGMARKLRLHYPGAIYHAMNRGDRREAIFNGDTDRLLFLDTLAETCEKTDWQVHAWCLMSNHFHLVSPKTAKIVDPVHVASADEDAISYLATVFEFKTDVQPEKPAQKSVGKFLREDRLARFCDNIPKLCLQIVPDRSGVDRSLKRLRPLAESPSPAPDRKSSLHRLLAVNKQQQSVEAGGERQHRYEGRGNDGWLEAPGQEGLTRREGCCVPGDRAAAQCPNRWQS